MQDTLFFVGRGMQMTNRTRMSLASRDRWTGLMFVSPWMIGFLLFTIFPMITSVYLTFVKWNFLRPPKWVGVDNVKSVFSNKTFYLAMENTLIFTAFSALIGLTFSLLIAAILAKNIMGGNAFRAILFLPSLVIGTAFGLMMSPVFGNGDHGLLNQLLNLLGMPSQSWLGVPGQAVWVMVGMTLWGIGGTIVIFLAGIKGIDTAYYEAAMIDGANSVQQFFRITVPLIAPVIVFNTIMSMIGGLQVFDIALALVNASGMTIGGMGPGNALATLVYYLYYLAFKDFNMGEAAVVAWVVFFISLILSLIVFRLSKVFNFFGTDGK